MGPDVERVRRPERAVLALVIALTALLAAGWSGVEQPVRHPQASFPTIALFALFVLFERKEIRIHIGSQGHDFTLAEIPIVLGLFLVSAPQLLIARLLSNIVVRVHRRQTPLKLAFNTALGVHDVVVPALFLRWLGEDAGGFGPQTWLALLLGVALAAVSSSSLVTWAIWLMSRQRATVRDAIGPSWLISLCSASVGLLLVHFIVDEPLALSLLAVPVIGLVAGYSAFERQVRERRRLEFLYRCTGAVSRATSTDEAAQAVLAECCVDLRSTAAELIVFSVDDDSFRYRARQDDGLQVDAHLPADVVDELRSVVAAIDDTAIVDIADDSVRAPQTRRWFRPMSWARRPVATGSLNPSLRAYLSTRGHSRVLVSPLTAGDTPFGLLIVGDRIPGTGEFGEDEIPVLRTLTDQISGTFESDALYDAVEAMRKLQVELAHQAGHDQLTGLPNRRRFMEALVATLEGRRSTDAATAAVLFIDLDDFKLANDTFGHAAGDALLVAVGERITALVRDGDVAARLGGDEFAVLLTDADRDRAELVARRILESFRLPVFHDGDQVMPAGSIGVAVIEQGTDVEEALHRADQAMYVAKQRGKGSLVDYDEISLDAEQS